MVLWKTRYFLGSVTKEIECSQAQSRKKAQPDAQGQRPSHPCPRAGCCSCDPQWVGAWPCPVPPGLAPSKGWADQTLVPFMSVTCTHLLCPWPPGEACTWDWRPLACWLGSSSAGELPWPRCPAALPLLDLGCFCLECNEKLWHHTKKDIHTWMSISS